MNKRNAVLLLPFLLLPLMTAGCDKAPNPVAPSGSVITLTANPSRITPSGESTITITGFRPDGNRLNPGTQIRLTSSLGSLSANIVEIGADGYASTKLKGDGRVGAAEVSAMLTTGDSASMVTVDIAATAPTLTIVVERTELEPGEEIFVTIFARGENDLPLGAGERIFLATTLGNLTVNGAEVDSVVTNSDGRAIFKFVAGDLPGTAEITAILRNSAVTTKQLTIRDVASSFELEVDRLEAADDEQIRLTVVVSNGAGRPARGILVIFGVDGAGGGLNPSSQTTGTEGQATSTFTFSKGALNAGDTFSLTATVVINGRAEVRQKTITVR